MTHPAMALIVDYYLMIHGHMVRYAEGLSEAQLGWQAKPDSLSIAFYLWHIARWADNLQSFIPGMTEELSQRLPPSPQIWKTRGLAKQWGFSSDAIGYDETGMEMDEAQAARLNFPSKDVLLEYLRATFTVIEAEVKVLVVGYPIQLF